jgi:homoserine kinase
VSGPVSGRRRIVRAPASSANLGPGYDVLGAALALELELEVTETGEYSFDPGGLAVPTDRGNLLVRSFERLHPADDISFALRSDIPLGRGLGSSAAAILAGLLAADHLYELGNSRDAIFALACEIEGHPDNVGAALFGGFVVCPPAGAPARQSAPDPIELALGTAPASGVALPAMLAPPEGVEAILVIPDDEVSTEAARAAMPLQLPVADAVQRRRRIPSRARHRALRPDPDRTRPRRSGSPALASEALPALDRRRRGGARPRRHRSDDLRRRPDRARLELLAVRPAGARGA